MLHLQATPDFLQEFYERCGGNLRIIKGVDVYPNLPGVSTVGRKFIDDHLSNRLVMMGEEGVPQWMYLCRGDYEKNPHVEWWTGPNEKILDSFETTARWNAFHVRFIEEMALENKKVCAGSINVGWPRLRMKGDPPPYPPSIRPTVEAVVRNKGIFALHEYGPGDMRIGTGSYCLRYRNTVEEWSARGIPTPNILIGEAGIDVPDPNFPLDHHHKGWTEFCTEEEFLVQLAWYLGELAKDLYVKGLALFTFCPWDWITFRITKSLAMGFADIIAAGPPVAQPTLTDISGALPQHPTDQYIERPMSAVKRTIIHHSVTNIHKLPDWEPPTIIEHIENIAEGHIGKRDFPAIGYHIVIGPKGDAYLVNRLGLSAWHAGRYYNPTSVGVCLLGRLHKHDPTAEQLLTAKEVCEELGYPIVPHKRLAQTACPGRWGKWGKAIRGDS